MRTNKMEYYNYVWLKVSKIPSLSTSMSMSLTIYTANCRTVLLKRSINAIKLINRSKPNVFRGMSASAGHNFPLLLQNSLACPEGS